MRRSALLLIVLLSTALAAKAQKPVATVRDATSQSSMMKERVAPLADTALPCAALYYKADSYFANDHYQKAYDTMKRFVETCPMDKNAAAAFSEMESSIQNFDLGDSSRYIRFREWCISVLYFNTKDPRYFCSDLLSISGTWSTTNQSLAVLRWMLLNTDCYHDYIAEQYTMARYSQKSTWLSGDTSVPLDTTLPSMADLGLDTVLAKHFLYGVTATTSQKLLSSAIASPNPAKEETNITFGLKSEAYVRIELFDVLGNGVEGVGYERLLESGEHSVPLRLHAMMPGTYYARLTTSYGESRTVKIVKE